MSAPNTTDESSTDHEQNRDELIAELQGEIQALKQARDRHKARADAFARQLDDFRDRLAALEDSGPQASTTPETSGDRFHPSLNRRQRAIVAGIAETHDSGDVLGVTTLRDAVRAHSDVSNPQTVKQYVKDITRTPHFEQVTGGGATSWAFAGVDDE